jgi:hypothetical protein
MTAIKEKEISNTKNMLTLTELDNRLGFHSEAEGYKYYPDKLKWRLQQLMPDNISEDDIYKIGSGWVNVVPGDYRWKIDKTDKGILHLEIEMNGHLEGLDDVSFGFDDNGGKFPLLFHAEHGGRIYDQTKLKDCTVIPGTDGWKVIVNLNPDDYSARRPLRFEVMRLTDNYQTRYSWPEKKVFRPGRLNLIFHQPCNMGILEE